MVNLDMVGRLQGEGDDNNKGGKLNIELGSGKNFAPLIDKLNESSGFLLNKRKDGTGSSDHESFYRQRIPVVYFNSGLHAEYHTPRDKVDLINFPGMKRIVDLADKVIVHLASAAERPEFVESRGGIQSAPKDLKGPRLGIQPYVDDSVKQGVKVGSVTDDGVAAAAGIKMNDVIVEIAGQPVTSVGSYVATMANQHAGQTIEIAVMRGGNRITLKATLK